MTQLLINGFIDGFIHIIIELDHVLFVLLLFYIISSFLKLLSLEQPLLLAFQFFLHVFNGLRHPSQF